MTKLEELIQELCPNGVKYLTIPELFITRNGYTPSKANAEFWGNGTIPWFRMEDIRENGRILTKSTQYVSEKAIKGKLVPEDSIIIATSATIGEHALIKVPSLANQRFTYLVLKDEFKSSVDMMFIFYYCFKLDEFCKTHLNQGNFASVDMKQFAEFKFPLPPLPVQREIVRILDNFTELTAELQEELQARKKQYEYYHNALMDFSNENIEYLSVGELFEIKNGLNKEKAAFGKGKPIINFTDVYNNRWLANGSFSGLVDVLDDEIKRYSAKIGDVFFTRTSETKEDIGMSSTLVENVPNCVFSGFVLRARPTTNLLLPKFCSYYFSTKQVRNTIVRYAAFTTRATTTGQKLSKIIVPILPIERQRRIVAILDRFYALCNDLTSGLPAEIEARQKQYEYYRDKLLSFHPLSQP